MAAFSESLLLVFATRVLRDLCMLTFVNNGAFVEDTGHAKSLIQAMKAATFAEVNFVCFKDA